MNLNLFVFFLPFFSVIRAKVVGEHQVDAGNDIYGHPIKRVKYDIKQIKVWDEPVGILFMSVYEP